MAQLIGNRTRRILAMVLSLALLATACGGGESVLDDVTGGVSDGAVSSSTTGSVSISGSSTVEPIAIRVAEMFESAAPGVIVDVDGPGTGDGFKLFCAGETDISNASRQIKEQEATSCREAGIEFTELRVAIDGIAVLTNIANDIDCLSFADMYSLIGPESIGIKTWAEANELAAAVGGAGGFPDTPLDLTAPGEESGTYDSFVEIVLEHFAEERAEEGLVAEDEIKTTRPDYSSSADDNVILQNVQGSPSSIGWVGFAFAANATNVKLIDIAEDAGGDCVSATEDTIASGEYPIARDLFVYVNNANAAANPALQEYVDFFMDEGLEGAVSEVGYVQLGADALAETRAAWG